MRHATLILAALLGGCGQMVPAVALDGDVDDADGDRATLEPWDSFEAPGRPQSDGDGDADGDVDVDGDGDVDVRPVQWGAEIGSGLGPGVALHEITPVRATAVDIDDRVVFELIGNDHDESVEVSIEIDADGLVESHLVFDDCDSLHTWGEANTVGTVIEFEITFEACNLVIKNGWVLL